MAHEGKFEYVGRVGISCQEGGFAEDAIELADLPGTGPKDVTHKFLSMMGQESGRMLADCLMELFQVGERDRMGDCELGRLRIVVERVADDE